MRSLNPRMKLICSQGRQAGRTHGETLHTLVLGMHSYKQVRSCKYRQFLVAHAHSAIVGEVG